MEPFLDRKWRAPRTGELLLNSEVCMRCTTWETYQSRKIQLSGDQRRLFDRAMGHHEKKKSMVNSLAEDNETLTKELPDSNLI